MHPSNDKWWSYCNEKYAKWCTSESTVLEVGSQYVNGSTRDHFNVKSHTGVDWREGGNVDVVCFAHEMTPDLVGAATFDAVISASMLEHDPHWEKSITNMVKFVKDDGILMLTWGSANNPIHNCETACDGGFHPLPVYKVFNLLESLGFYIHEFCYDDIRWAEGLGKEFDPDGVGAGADASACLVAVKDKSLLEHQDYGERIIEEWDLEDCYELWNGRP